MRSEAVRGRDGVLRGWWLGGRLKGGVVVRRRERREGKRVCSEGCGRLGGWISHFANNGNSVLWWRIKKKRWVESSTALQLGIELCITFRPRVVLSLSSWLSYTCRKVDCKRFPDMMRTALAGKLEKF